MKKRISIIATAGALALLTAGPAAARDDDRNDSRTQAHGRQRHGTMPV